MMLCAFPSRKRSLPDPFSEGDEKPGVIFTHSPLVRRPVRAYALPLIAMRFTLV